MDGTASKLGSRQTNGHGHEREQTLQNRPQIDAVQRCSFSSGCIVSYRCVAMSCDAIRRDAVALGASGLQSGKSNLESQEQLLLNLSLQSKNLVDST